MRKSIGRSKMEKMVLSVEECCEVLGLSRNTLYERIADGSVPSVRLGKRILIPVAGLEKMLSQVGKQKEEAGQCPAR
jgi:excisionase family DNA binding protein